MAGSETSVIETSGNTLGIFNMHRKMIKDNEVWEPYEIEKK